MFRNLPSIPYMGSKREIACDIVNFIRINNPKAKVFIDMFGGGGAITVQALYQGFNKVIYNELNPRIFNLMKFLSETEEIPKNWWKWISREEFKEIIESNDNSAFAGMIECCWSFGNKGDSYIYGKEIEDIKRLCEDVVVNKSKKSSKELKDKYKIEINPTNEKTIYERYLKGFKPQLIKNKLKRLDLQRLERLQRLQRLQRLERLQRLQRLQRLERLQCFNKSYIDALKKIDLSSYKKEEVVVYCDPPYRGTAEYVSGAFNYKEFDDWFLSLPYKAYLSEYNSPFEKVYSVKKRVTLSSTNKSLSKEECLFINKISNKKEVEKIEEEKCYQMDLL